MTDVRHALRRELELRGLVVGDDTVAYRAGLYVKGRGDLAAGLFEFKRTAQDAIETMYQGNWNEDLPPRFAVLPAHEASDPAFELLEQMHINPLLYETLDDGISFLELESVVQKLRH